MKGRDDIAKSLCTVAEILMNEYDRGLRCEQITVEDLAEALKPVATLIRGDAAA